jgi:hypothetical protein
MPLADLSQVTIVITSFLRPGYLYDCLDGIHKRLQECRTLVVDDSGFPLTYMDWKGNDDLITMNFDSGLSTKRNSAVLACKTKYFLMGCDDFDFSTREAREGIELLIATLDSFQQISVAGGRVEGNPYEGFLEYVPGEYIQEHRLDTSGMKDGDCRLCDLTVNYFLTYRDVPLRYPWDNRMKIGGEHGDWFLTLKESGVKVAFVKGVNITTLPYDPAKQDPRYAGYRSRAVTLGHRIFMEKRNIKEYRGFA